MAEERLDYIITVQDKATKALSDIDTALQRTKQEFATLKTEVGGLATVSAGIRQVGNQIKNLGNTSSTNKLKQAAGNVSLLAGAFGQLSREAQGVADVALAFNTLKNAARGFRSPAGLQKLITGVQQLNTALAGLNVQQAVTNVARLSGAIANLRNNAQQAQGAFGPLIQQLRQVGATAAIAQRQVANVGTGIRAQRAAAQDAEKGFNVLGSTLGRLTVAFLAFRAFQLAGEGLGALVSQGVQFNSTLEQTKLAIQALIPVTNRVIDGQKHLLTGAEAFTAVEGEADRQLQLLLKDALRTSSTFEQLGTNFQVALAAANGSGLDITQVRKLTLAFSQAATVLRVPQEQLSEEIRSLLQGTVSGRNTRFAQIFGGLSPEQINQLIKGARQSGTLFEELTTRLGPFSVAAEKASQSLSVLFSNLQENVLVSLGAASTQLFNDLKESLSGFNTFLTNDFLNNKEVEAAFAPFQNTLDALLKSVTDAEPQALVEIVRLFGNLIEIVVDGLRPVITSLIEAFGGLAAGINPALEAMTSLERKGGDTFGTFARGIKVIGLFIDTLAKLGDVSDLAGLSIELIGQQIKKFIIEQMRLSTAEVETEITRLQNEIAKKFLPDSAKILEIALQGIFGTGPDAGGPASLKPNTNFAGDLLSKDSFKQARTNLFRLRQELVGVKDEITSVDKIEAARAERSAKLPPLLEEQKLLLLEINAVQAAGFETDAEHLKELKERLKLTEEEIKLEDKVLEAKRKASGSPVAAVTGGFLQRIVLEFQKAKAANEEADQAVAKAVTQEEKLAAGQAKFAAESAATAQGVVRQADVVKGTYLALFEFLGSAVEQLTATISKAILDAFLDPQADIRDSFAQLFRALAQQLLQLLLQALVVKAVSSAGVALGFAQGGEVPSRGPKPTAMHARARGYSVGFRPRGLNPKDTIPAWLSPGEWVIPAARALAYGPSVMEGIRTGSLDPGVLKSMARGIEPKAARGPGYASGGPAAAPARGGPGVAVVVGGAAAVEQLFSQDGASALVRIMGDNASEINAVLGTRVR